MFNITIFDIITNDMFYITPISFIHMNVMLNYVKKVLCLFKNSFLRDYFNFYVVLVVDNIVLLITNKYVI